MNCLAEIPQSAWLIDVPVDVQAAIAGPTMRVREIVALRIGAIISTSRRSGDNIDVLAGDAVIGSGELCRCGGELLIRMVRIGGRN